MTARPRATPSDMTRRAARQSDIVKAIKAVNQSGVRSTVRVLTDGSILIAPVSSVDEPTIPAPSLPPIDDREPNEWDEVLT